MPGAALENAGTFDRHFARLLRPYHRQVGPLIFEFGTFNKATFPNPGDFYEYVNRLARRGILTGSP